nr:fasciclin domain-containing protein [Sphingomonas sp.]
LMSMIRSGGGRATLRTVQGAPLYASMMGSTVMLTDAKGNTGHVTQGDVMQSNGVIHVVDTVLMPS